MLGKIVPQTQSEVKPCADEHCAEDIFRDGPLCFDHFVKVETAAWDDEDAERQMVLEGVGYVFSDPMLEGAGYILSDPAGEVYR